MKEGFKYKYDDLFNPTLRALHNLGGSGSVPEIEEQVALILNLTEDQIAEIHRGTISKLTYRLAWSRNYLKRCGILENSSRGVWALTSEGKKLTAVDKEEIKRIAKASESFKAVLNKMTLVKQGSEEIEEIKTFSWQEEIIETLLNIKPDAFERICQRLLRELGFQNVEVTGKSNDGGIDGKGFLKIGSILSFQVIFQAKRYKGSVSPSIVRDFRGAMVGRADKGLIITTGTFSREARKEAQRDGAPQIDLLDGNDLAEKFKELKLGVEIEMVEQVRIKKDWFMSI